MNIGTLAAVKGAGSGLDSSRAAVTPRRRLARRATHALVFLVLPAGLLGCKPGSTPLALIHYSQLGACTSAQTGNGVVDVPANHAVIIFRVTQIDNTSPPVSWSFDSTRLTVNGDDNQQNLGGIGPVNIPAHQKVNLNTRVGIMVETGNADGTDASAVNYFLLYPSGTSAPGTVAVKANSSQVSYPFTRDCNAIAGS